MIDSLMDSSEVDVLGYYFWGWMEPGMHCGTLEPQKKSSPPPQHAPHHTLPPSCSQSGHVSLNFTSTPCFGLTFNIVHTTRNRPHHNHQNGTLNTTSNRNTSINTSTLIANTSTRPTHTPNPSPTPPTNTSNPAPNPPTTTSTDNPNRRPPPRHSRPHPAQTRRPRPHPNPLARRAHGPLGNPPRHGLLDPPDQVRAQEEDADGREAVREAAEGWECWRGGGRGEEGEEEGGGCCIWE